MKYETDTETTIYYYFQYRNNSLNDSVTYERYGSDRDCVVTYKRYESNGDCMAVATITGKSNRPWSRSALSDAW